MSEFHSKIVGVTAKNSDGTNRQDYIKKYCKPSKELILHREPDNPYDSNAIAVFIKTKMLFFINTAFQIGYINSDIASELSKHMEKGGKVIATVKNITGGTGEKSYGVNILIQKT